MPQRLRSTFTTVTSEGALLPVDLLQRVALFDTSLGGISAEDYHLFGDVKLNEAINEAWLRMLRVWQAFQTARARLPESDAATTLTRERWLLPLFAELGYGRLVSTKPIEIDEKSYPLSHSWQHLPIHLVSYKLGLDTLARGSGSSSRYSPYSLVQELVNRSPEHLWGMVSNGMRLRLLRKNVSLTRQAYVEFDLEAMMQGENYADFVLFWLLCHQSRVEAERSSECWLEKWSRLAHDQGVRALDRLRGGVEDAINAFGSGFLAHPANGELRRKLREGDLSSQDYYREVLRFVYRLIILFVAEDRAILFHPLATDAARTRYNEYYSTHRLRHLAGQRIGTRHSDLFHVLWLVMEQLGRVDGCEGLGLPALNGFLFSQQAVPDLAGCELANHELLNAVRSLAFTYDGKFRRNVDYKNLGAEELGSIYESLLELHPDLNVEAATFVLKTASGNERKTSGSYYTPTSLIECLLDSALEPVLSEATHQPDPEAAILNLKVCDPACGSGHFLIAAAHRIAKRLAAVRTGNEEPAAEERRAALRDVVGHCIYGVDINPMAVELCKVNLWMEAIEPGKPLSFLDAHIQCGNSLLGATPALLHSGIPDSAFEPIEGDDKKICASYKKMNKAQRAGQLSLLAPDAQPWDSQNNLSVNMKYLDEMDDGTVEQLHRKQDYYANLVISSDYLNGRQWADAWCAAFVWKKNKDLLYPITEEIFRKIGKNPHSVPDWMQDEIVRLREQYQFFHWHLAFPDVFNVPAGDEAPENEQAAWSGGFDVVLGNPPWERIKIQEKEWFAARRPDIANAANAAQRRRMISALVYEDPELYKAFLEDQRQATGESHFVRDTGRYPLCGRGDVNTYSIFAENMRLAVSGVGRVGCIVPSGIATDDTNKFFFRDLMESHSLVSLYDFDNLAGLFPSVDSRFKFCLLTLTASAHTLKEGAEFAFFLHATDDLRESERYFIVSNEDLSLINPNTYTCPVFRSKHDLDLTISIYRHFPILIKKSSPERNPWNIKLSRMFDMTNDAALFRSRDYLKKDSYNIVGNTFCNTVGDRYIPLYEGRLGHQFNHRFASQPGGQLQEVSVDQLANPEFFVEPQYWVHMEEVSQRLKRYSTFCTTGLLGFRRVSRNTDERTSISSIIPWGAASYGWILVLGPKATDLLLLLGVFNSFSFDYLLRNTLSQPSIPQGTFEQIPCPSPDIFKFIINFSFIPPLLELTYTAWDLEAFAHDCGYDGPPFRWDEERRFLLRCELDAAYFHLYGIARDDVDYIMETFPIVKRKDEKQYHDYRTKRMILEIYDEMQRAIETGIPYRTRLDPPPADPAVAHPTRTGVEVRPEA